MQEYRRIDITRDQIVPIAERMRKSGRYLVMIHAFIDKDGQMDISYDYAVDPAIESYHVAGETKVPSWSIMLPPPRSTSRCRSASQNTVRQPNPYPNVQFVYAQRSSPAAV